MALKMTAELDRIFDEVCSEDSLSAKDTCLVALAAQLAGHRSASTASALKIAGTIARPEEIKMVVCMCACTAGFDVNERVLELGVLQTSEPANACRERSLDARTTHLVGLASCLAAGCACAEGHIVAGRNAGLSEEELARCACIASCVAGRVNKFRFLEARQNVEGCTACVC